MTYSIPRSTAIKGNVTIKSAKRGLNKRDSLCATCIESSDTLQRTCRSCEGKRIPAPMITLAGFDYGINGTYMFTEGGGRWSSWYWSAGAKVSGPAQYCLMSKSFVYSGNDVTGHPTNRGRFTIDAQWPLKSVNISGQDDSSFLNGSSGLNCRNVEYTNAQGEHECRECGGFTYGQPSSLAADLLMKAYFHNRPITVEMGARYIRYRSGWRWATKVGGGIWDYNGGNLVQIQSARVFELPPGITFIVHVRNNEIVNPYAVLPGYDKGWSYSPVGDQPVACAVYHAPLPLSLTATDDEQYSLLECFGKNLNLSFVAKSQQSDAMVKNYKGVSPKLYRLDGTAPSVIGCPGLVANPPFEAQTADYFKEMNDFGNAGTVTLSTSEAIVDIFLGDDFAAEIEADASCTVTDG